MPGPRVGVWGLFDLEDLGTMLFPEVLRHELRRRLPSVELVRFAPETSRRRNRFDVGDAIEPLGAWSPGRLAELADSLDCAVVGGALPAAEPPLRFLAGGLGEELERRCPVAWSAVSVPHELPENGIVRDALEARAILTVRDDPSSGRLARAGVRRHAEVVPDPTVLARRVWAPDVLERRLRYLRRVGAYPNDPPLVVQGTAAGPEGVEALAASIRGLAGDGLPVVVIETDPARGDDRVAAALAEALGPSARSASPLGLQDVAAAIAASRGFIGASAAGAAVAVAFDVPHLLIGWRDLTTARAAAEGLGEPSALVERPEDVARAFRTAARRTDRAEIRRALEHRIDRHLDEVAGLAADAAPRRPGARETDPAEALAGLRRAHRVRGRLLAAQRWQTAEGGAKRGSKLQEQVAGVRGTRILRYAAALRRRYRERRERRHRGEIAGRVLVPAAELPRVSILMVTFDGWDWPLRTLRSLVEHTEPGYEVIIVDNGSSDRTRGWLREQVEGATIVLNARNVGFASAVARAALEARAPFLCLLNPDVLVRPGWLSPLRRALEDPRVGAVVPRYLFPDGRLHEAGSVVDRAGRSLAVGTGSGADDPVHLFPRVIDYGSAACLLLRRSSFHLVGGLDPIYHPAYVEDVDLAFSLQEHGLRVLYEPRSTVVHAGAGSTDDETRGRLIERNRVIFLERWRHRLRGRPRLGAGRSATLALRDIHTPDRLLAITRAPPAPGSGLERLLTEASLGWETARVTLMPLEGTRDVRPLLDRGVEVAPATAEELEARRFHYAGVLIDGPQAWERLGPAVLRSQPHAVRIYDPGPGEPAVEALGLADAVPARSEEEAARIRRLAPTADVMVGAGAAEVMALLGAEPPQVALPSVIPRGTPSTSTVSR